MNEMAPRGNYFPLRRGTDRETRHTVFLYPDPKRTPVSRRFMRAQEEFRIGVYWESLRGYAPSSSRARAVRQADS